MSQIKSNTGDANAPEETTVWGAVIFLSVLVSVLFFPLVYWAWEGVASVLVSLTNLVNLVWTGVGHKGVFFVMCALGLSGLCMLVRGREEVKAGGTLIFLGLFLFLVFSVMSARKAYLYDLVEGKSDLDALTLSQVHQELAKNPIGTTQGRNQYGTQGDTIRRLASGNYARGVSRQDCEKLQQLAWNSKAFGERYVLFVENQVSTRQTPVKCSWFSYSAIVVAYNATYAPNGMVATIEAARAK